MEIKNTTYFNKEAYYTLNKSISGQIFIVGILFEIVLSGIACYFLFISKEYLKGIIIILLMISFPFVLNFFINNQIKKTYKSSEQVLKETKYDYIFTENNISITSANMNIQSQDNITYQAIYKVIETVSYLFIFISSNQAYVVSKDSFENDDLNIVINKIKEENVKYKYKKIKVK